MEVTCMRGHLSPYSPHASTNPKSLGPGSLPVRSMYRISSGIRSGECRLGSYAIVGMVMQKKVHQ